MTRPLLQRFFGFMLLLFLLVLGSQRAHATHLLGGEMSYRYLDANGPANNPFRYEITVTIYSNGLYTNANPNGVAAPPVFAPVDIYSRTTGLRILSLSVARTSPTATNANLPAPVVPSVPLGCAVVGPRQPFYLCKYVQTVNLPVSFDGYYAVYSVGARNTTLTNISNPNNGTGGDIPLTLYVSMAPPLISNRSPVFSDTAVAIVCQNDTTISLNNAFDPDGDRLVYSFGTPYGATANFNQFPPFPQPVPYYPGFSGTKPFGTGAGNFALINATTGIAKYGAMANGLYGVAVDVSEYRTINGREVLLGTTRRDLQLVVSTCPPTPAPVLPPAIVTPRDYTIEEGQSLSIPIRATQASSNHPLVLTVNSALLDGNGPFNSNFNGNPGTVAPGNLTGTATATGNGVVSGTFVFNSTCGNARASAYDLAVTVKDNGCGGKLASDLFRITVTRALGASSITGPAAVCDPASVQTYSAAGPVLTSYSWRVVGGTISSGQGTGTVRVAWGNAIGTGSLVLKGVSQYGCRSDSVVKTVDIRPLAPLAVTSTASSICLGAPTTLTVTGPAGLIYTWTGGGQSLTGRTVTVTPIATTTYTVTGTDGTCTISASTTVTVTPLPNANAGPNRNVCPGVASTPLGTAPVVGVTYAWSPALGLSSTTAAQPTVTLPNTTGAPFTATYTLVTTTANGCSATGTVTVTVSPTALANAGPDAALCDHKRLTIGTAALPGYTYSWSPAANLSSATAAQPVLTGVNATSSPISLIYALTATSASGCVATDTVVIVVNPRPAPDAITGPTSVCPTVAGIAYTVLNPAATAYQWLVTGGTVASGQGTPAITVNWGAANPAGAVRVFRLNAQGCSSDTTALPVVINQRLQTVRPTGPGDIVAVAPLPRAVCQADGPYTYRSGQFANGSSYSWSIVGGTQVSSNQNTVTVSWNPVTVPTIGKIVVTETSNPTGGICRGVSDTLRVLVNPSPRTNLAIVGPARVCQGGGPVTFSLPGGFAGSSFVFQLNGSPLAGTGNSRTLATLPAPGTYTLTAQETTASPAGCVGPLYSVPFTVAPLPTAPVISGSGFVCNTATAQQYAIANATPGATYQWSVTGGAVASGGTSSQVTVRFNATGPYAVSAAEISPSPASCLSPTTTRTILFDSPGIALTNASVDVGSNSRVILTLTAPNSALTPNPVQILRRVAGVGSFVPVGTVAASATTYSDNNAVDASANSYEYQLSLVNGCGTALASSVVQTIRLVAVASPGTGGRDQGSTALTWNAYVGFAVARYQIFRRLDNGSAELLTTVAAGTLQTTVPNTNPVGATTGAGFNQRFRVVAITDVSSGVATLSSNSNEASVDFASASNAYNIITPNRDGQNDVLVIDNIQLYPGNTFAVFNRWGREVYKTTNYQNNWGGDDNTASGNYFYVLKLPNGTSVKNWFEVVK